MTVDTSYRTYSILRIQFRPATTLFRLGRRIDKMAKRSKLLKSLRKWLKTRKRDSGNIVEHKIKIPIELCNHVSHARDILNSHSSSGEGACQLFINENWSELNPYTCTKKTVGSFEDNSFMDSSALCFIPGFIEEIDSLRKSLSGKFLMRSQKENLLVQSLN